MSANADKLTIRQLGYDDDYVYSCIGDNSVANYRDPAICVTNFTLEVLGQF